MKKKEKPKFKSPDAWWKSLTKKEKAMTFNIIMKLGKTFNHR